MVLWIIEIIIDQRASVYAVCGIETFIFELYFYILYWMQISAELNLKAIVGLIFPACVLWMIKNHVQKNGPSHQADGSLSPVLSNEWHG